MAPGWFKLVAGCPQKTPHDGNKFEPMLAHGNSSVASFWSIVSAVSTVC